MKTTQSIYLFLFILILFACQSKNKFPYAIRDFRKSLQPYLTKAVSNNIIAYDYSVVKNATNDELKKLSQSEHPILRAIAFKQMLLKPEFNHFDILMNNLDDTAIVAVDHGEWGVDKRLIADDILRNGGWKTQEDKNKTIDRVLTKHNRLASAYFILPQLPPQEKYYLIIKEMAQQDRNFENEIINALYASAKFKKKEDVAFIKEMILKNEYGMPKIAFSIMEDYPSETYFEIYKKPYLRNFYYCICKNTNRYEPENFIKSVATFKNEASANLLDSILNKKPFLPCVRRDSSDWTTIIMHAIKDNECKAYLRFNKQVTAYLKKEEEEREKNSIPYPSYSPENDLQFEKRTDTIIEPIKWGYND